MNTKGAFKRFSMSVTPWLAPLGMEGVPEFLACERIAPVEARGACQASTHFHNTAEGTKNNRNMIDISCVISCKGLL